MNLQVAKKDFLSVITRAASVADRKSTMPALALAKLTTADSRLVVETTDLYQSFSDGCSAEISRSGGAAVNAADLVARVKSMPDGPVELTTKDHALTIKAKGLARKFTLRGMDPNDFPPMPKCEADAAKLTIEASVLASLIAHTAFAVSTDETRAHLNSLLIEWTGDTLRAVSTDGHRLAKAERKVSGNASLEMLLPLKAVRAIHELATGMVGEAEKPAALTLLRQGPTAFFIAGTATFSVKLVDAQFPPYVQVIPKSVEKTARAPRADLIDAIQAVSVAASDRTGGVKLMLSKGKLALKSESADSGDGDDEIPIEYAGPNMSIGFNARYLLEALKVLSSEEVTLGLNGELDPMTIQPVQSAGTDSVAVSMPMRI